MVVLLYNKIGLNILINKLPVLSGVTPYSIYVIHWVYLYSLHIFTPFFNFSFTKKILSGLSKRKVQQNEDFGESI